MLNEVVDEAGLAEVAERCLRILKGGSAVALLGELGAGKTTFVRSFCLLAETREPVSSPSFVLEYEYHTKTSLCIEHWDLYRTHDLPEELCEPPATDSIRFIEWANRVPGLCEKCDLVIALEFVDNPLSGKRRVCLNGPLAGQLLAGNS